MQAQADVVGRPLAMLSGMPEWEGANVLGLASHSSLLLHGRLQATFMALAVPSRRHGM